MIRRPCYLVQLVPALLLATGCAPAPQTPPATAKVLVQVGPAQPAPDIPALATSDKLLQSLAQSCGPMFPGKDARQVVETLRPALQVQPVPDSELYDLNVALPSRAHSLAVLALWCEAWAAFGDARSNNNAAAEMLSETAGDLERQLADAERALLEHIGQFPDDWKRTESQQQLATLTQQLAQPELEPARRDALEQQLDDVRKQAREAESASIRRRALEAEVQRLKSIHEDMLDKQSQIGSQSNASSMRVTIVIAPHLANSTPQDMIEYNALRQRIPNLPIMSVE